MTGRGQANVLTRATGILAALFFVTSLSLTVLAGFGHGQRSILDGAPVGGSTPAAPAALPPKGEGSVLDQLRKLEEQKASQPSAPAPEAPTGPAPPRGQ
jgi:preprotein translocase subunit SecG